VLALTVKTTIDPLIGTDEILKTQSWIDPPGAAALQRIRLRQGSDFWQKSYRFTRNGVYRLRKKPQNAGEKKLAADQWTKVRNHFYAYGETAKDCQQILEPASLLSIVSADKVIRSSFPLHLCVFNKKQVHRATATVGGRLRTHVNYLQPSEPGRPRRDADIEAIKISFQTRCLASENETPEQFSFLGLKGNFDILVDPESGLPVRVSGKAATFGEMTLRLHAVEFVQNVR
jgi:hypothetical protein